MSRKYQYPPDWAAIARAVKERAGWMCEQCGVPHGAIIFRSIDNPRRWRYATDAEVIDDSRGAPRPVTVELSVHHKGVDYSDGTPGDPDDKLDNRPENLVALCARCHFIEEIKAGAARKARETRVRRKQEAARSAGQREMF